MASLYSDIRNKLYVGQKLKTGEELESQNERYKAIMQDDGNFVVYTNHFGNRLATWASGTNGKGGNFFIVQDDGNMVIYMADGTPVWASNTHGRRVWYIVLQNDGNLVAYGDGGALWASNTHREIDQLRAKYREDLRHSDALISRNGRYKAIMQEDGNFVVYDEKSEPIWASDTYGSGATQLIMQDDGNVVVYAPGKKAKWSSGTNGKTASHLIMQNDGNLVLYGNHGALWATGTNR